MDWLQLISIEQSGENSPEGVIITALFQSNCTFSRLHNIKFYMWTSFTIV